jgi:hypothetical protein
MSKQTLFCPQGTDFSTSLTLTNDDGTFINVASYIFGGVVRKNYYSTNPSANLNIVKSDAANGSILAQLDSANTANLEQGTYLYTIQQSVANVASIMLDGMFIVTPSVLMTQPTPQTTLFPQVLPNTTNIDMASTDQYA